MEHTSLPGEPDPSQAASTSTSTPAPTTSAFSGAKPKSISPSTGSSKPQTQLQKGNSTGTQTTTSAMAGRRGSPGGVRLPLVPTPTRSMWSIHICPTTGGQFQLCATPEETIDGLKKTIAKKLKLTKERITLLNKERVLKEGSLRDNGIFEGCKLTLLPNVESGLMSQRPEHTVMQALENLSDIQVNDFLSGKSPLTLAMRLGDHMMFVQLQLSTSPPNSRRSGSSRAASSSASPSLTSASPPASPTTSSAPSSSKTSPVLASLGTPLSPLTSPTGCLPTPPSSPGSPTSPVPFSAPAGSHLGFSPFMLPPHTPLHHHRHHHSHYHNRHRTSSPSTSSSPGSPCCSSSSSSSSSLDSSASSTPPQSPPCTPPAVPKPTPTFNTPVTTSTAAKPTTVSLDNVNVPLLDSSALAEASRNLSQKLKELSQASNVTKEVKQTTTTQTSSKANGAIIESMQHHGQGIYSGTFSGTLNPALQDRDGKPKRSISTIVHILNDLLGATPQYRAQLQARPAHPAVASHLQGAEKPHPYHYHHHHHHHHHHHVQQHRHQGSETPRTRAQGETSRVSQESRRISQENRATRGKMEQIQQMLEERRQRRRARREARSTPYSRSWSAARGNRAAAGDSGLTSTLEKHTTPEQPMEVDVETSNLDKVQEKGAYGELTQETVVA